MIVDCAYDTSTGFYFQCAIIVIGFVGTALNGLILYALIASKQHRKLMLIFNQNLLDFVSCFFLFTTQAIKHCNVPNFATSHSTERADIGSA